MRFGGFCKSFVWVAVLLCLMVFGPATATAQKCVELDLTEGNLGFDPSVSSVTCVQLNNALPGAEYEVELKVKSCIAPLSTEFFAVDASQVQQQVNARSAQTPCEKAAAELKTSLNSAKSEEAVKKAIAKYNKDKGGNCTAGDADIALTQKKVDASAVAGDDKTIAVAVTRVGKAGSWNEKRWQNDPKCSGWQATYGFTFVPNRDREFFSKAQDDGSFVITEKADREEGDYLAAIMFQYYQPGKKRGPIFGLGYDAKDISALAGYGFIFNRNVTLSFGVAVHERTDLAGQYNDGDPLAEALTEEQLTEETYVPNLFVGISFRFGSNVFAGQ